MYPCYLSLQKSRMCCAKNRAHERTRIAERFIINSGKWFFETDLNIWLNSYKIKNNLSLGNKEISKLKKNIFSGGVF